MNPAPLLTDPVVSAVDRWPGRRHRTGLTAPDLAAYSPAQVVGGIAGAVLANVVFETADRADLHHRPQLPRAMGRRGRVHHRADLVLARTGRASLSAVAVAVASGIGAAYWFTCSTLLADPAVTISRMFGDTFAGIGPASVPEFVLAQVSGAAIGVGLTVALYPGVGSDAGAVVVQREST